jgi:FAD synthetase
MANLWERIQEYLATPDPSTLRSAAIDKAREAIAVIEEAHQRYGTTHLAISYNGGKDCLVLLLLYIAFLDHTEGSARGMVPTVYVTIQDPFEEVDDFVMESAERYRLHVDRINLPMKEAFASYLNAHPDIQAVLVGTRRGDPHGALLTHFDMTDHGWPSFMRVHPIINWTYSEIWDFLLALEEPYCVLYDRGYTSLGGTGDTLPNPVLQTQHSGGVTFQPAWALTDGKCERRGREEAKKSVKQDVVTRNRRTSMDHQQQRPR